MSMFHVGQRVVCIRESVGTFFDRMRRDGFIYPSKGCVYTIRCIGPGNMEILLLEEIINRIPIGDRFEPGYHKKNFRPVKDTSIEVFRKLLAPMPEREDA